MMVVHGMREIQVWFHSPPSLIPFSGRISSCAIAFNGGILVCSVHGQTITTKTSWNHLNESFDTFAFTTKI
jgi:hypothetical protein